MKKIIIAIDGYSACGKSTMAKQLAKKLNYTFIDSGAMYRAITLYMLRNNIATTVLEKYLATALTNISLRFVYNDATGQRDIFLNNKNVATKIRDMHVSENVSAYAALKLVRNFAVAQQQQMGLQKAIVMDGRDIGTNVFPHAELKIFVTASIEVRTQRRWNELNKTVAIESVRANLEMRDHTDSTRFESPLCRAADAVLLNNSALTMEQQLAIVLQWAQEKIK